MTKEARRDDEIACDDCGTVVMGIRNGTYFSNAVRGRCDWDNCITHSCPGCGHVKSTSSFGLAGSPDCPCDGRRVPPLRWPWTSPRFVDAYCSYHLWAFGLRVGGRWWQHLLIPIPYLLFGDFTGTQYRYARLNDPEYFERKRNND
ncbi:hypothetical protein ACFRAQ_35955 [Nocardia sp. NPDC056611]|uniref:hypothetical protein n=1 Tax=Nocardia sp. NPDC056611 TaxID=3345877 RepID=UPI00366A757D